MKLREIAACAAVGVAIVGGGVASSLFALSGSGLPVPASYDVPAYPRPDHVLLGVAPNIAYSARCHNAHQLSATAWAFGGCLVTKQVAR